MIHSFASIAEVLPLRDQLFDPVSLAGRVANTPLVIFAVLLFTLAAAYLALWWTARDYPVFRGMSLYIALSGAQMIWMYEGGTKSNWALVALTAPVLVMIAGTAMRVYHCRWALLIWPFSLFVFFAGWFPAFRFLRTTTVDVSDLMILVLVFLAVKRGQRRDRQVAAAFSMYICVRSTLSSNFLALTHFSGGVEIGGWSWAFTPPAIVLLGTATLVIYVRDLIEDRREKQRMSAELEAARTVQQVLVPEEIPVVPGFSLQAVYRPFGEVGGDFFQILDLSNGGVLVVIGDVSGKGMPAAMTVSLLVGTVRTLAHFMQNPGEILAAMNLRMLGRGHGGFTTCLVLRADAGGQLTLANAGHIAPYLEGKELPLENGLPLGLAAEAAYAESTFQLSAGQQLTLMTDGVAEARDRSGQLLGFERTAGLSKQPAEAIAAAAQAFGQDDDITVLTVARSAVPA